MKKLIFTALGFLFISSQINAQCFINPNNVSAYSIGTKNYGVIKEAKTWSAARACAVQFNGRLAVIEDQREQDSLFSILNRASINNASTVAPDGGNASYVWLGGNDKTTEGTWVWDNYVGGTGQFWQGARNGSVVGGLYNNWGNEPDNFQNQDALGFALTAWPFGTPGQWNDVDENNLLYFVIEYPGTVNVEEIFQNTRLAIAPNPVEDALILTCEDCKFKKQMIRIIDSKGSLIYQAIHDLKQAVNVEFLQEGNYILQLEDGSSIKFLKN